MHIGIVGALGLVGKELVTLLEEDAFRNAFSPISLKGYGSKSRPCADGFYFSGQNHPVDTLEGLYQDIPSLDLLFIAAPNKVSQEIIKEAQAQNTQCLIIDGSSAFRMEKDVPLIIPEVNQTNYNGKSKLISSPNCVATLMLLALAPLHTAFGLKRIISSSYQAASGGGKALLDTLIHDTKAHLREGKSKKGSKAFSIYPHESKRLENGYVEEEMKVIEEVRKILNLPSLPISLRSIRTPCLRAHGISLNIEFEKKPDLIKAKEVLEKASGITYLQSSATLEKATFQKEIFCSDLRYDLSSPYSLELWIVGDQLLKGSALNMLQIAKVLLEATSIKAP